MHDQMTGTLALGGISVDEVGCMDRRTLLRGGLALAGGLALMPSLDPMTPVELAARTHELRRRHEEALPDADQALEMHAAALAALMRYKPRPGLGSVTAEACEAAALAASYSGRFGAAEQWASLGRKTAAAADDPDMYVMNATRMMRPLLYQSKPEETLRVLRDASARYGRRLSPYARLYLEVHTARLSAVAGEHYSSVAAIDRADIALDEALVETKPNWARTVGPNWLASWRGVSALEMRRPHLAEAPLRQVLERAPARVVRTRAHTRVNLAQVAWARQDLDEACTLLTEAFPVIKQVGGHSDLSRVRRLRRSFEPHSDSPHVRALDEVLTA